MSRSATLPRPMALLSTRGWMETVISALALPHFVVVSYLRLFKSLSPSSFSSFYIHQHSFDSLFTCFTSFIRLNYIQSDIAKMTSIGRIACILFPYAATVGALISLIFVGIGCTNSHSTTQNDLYFFRVRLLLPHLSKRFKRITTNNYRPT